MFLLMVNFLSVVARGDATNRSTIECSDVVVEVPSYAAMGHKVCSGPNCFGQGEIDAHDFSIELVDDSGPFAVSGDDVIINHPSFQKNPVHHVPLRGVLRTGNNETTECTATVTITVITIFLQIMFAVKCLSFVAAILLFNYFIVFKNYGVLEYK